MCGNSGESIDQYCPGLVHVHSVMRHVKIVTQLEGNPAVALLFSIVINTFMIVLTVFPQLCVFQRLIFSFLS